MTPSKHVKETMKRVVRSLALPAELILRGEPVVVATDPDMIMSTSKGKSEHGTLGGAKFFVRDFSLPRVLGLLSCLPRRRYMVHFRQQMCCPQRSTLSTHLRPL